jgi:molybdenum cofactor cytidylyltransferase
MRFGAVAVGEAEDGLLAHQVRAGEIALKKSHRLSAADCAALAAAGVERVVIARLEDGDLGEDEAARRLAAAAAGEGVRVDPAFTGRANLFAKTGGLFLPDRAAIDRFNTLDPSITLATLPAFKRVEPGEMIATVKIIPFAAPEAAVEAGVALIGAAALRVMPFAEKRVAMLSLRLPGLKESVIDKTVRVTEARLAALGSRLVSEVRLDHSQPPLEAALKALDLASVDIILVFGAAAIADIHDVIPSAIEAVGGEIVHFGMPVDPGNLLLIGNLKGCPVIGAPGCARSPRENGFDWVLARLSADVPVTAAEVRGMGVGGLLMEIVSRPQPRAGSEAAGDAKSVVALVLAAGRSTRFGASNKLLAPLNGRPMLAHVVERIREAGLGAPFVVTGHEADTVAAQVAGSLPEATIIPNPDYATGLSSSIRAGIAALPEKVGAALILLGDMPKVSAATLKALAEAAADEPGMEAFVPVFEGRWGNPVLVRRSLFPSLAKLHGDQGARKLLEASREVVREVAVDDAGVLADVDTPEALEAVRRP